MTDRRLDLVLHGATGYVGRLTARHLAERAGGLRVGLSGRSEQRLRAVRNELGVDWPLLVTDAGDRASVVELAAASAVVATTVEPYRRYGLPLVEACAEHGTSYCDLTGETLFVRASADAAHRQAVATEARIVHSAGFDSVPSDRVCCVQRGGAGVRLAGSAGHMACASSVKAVARRSGGGTSVASS